MPIDFDFKDVELDTTEPEQPAEEPVVVLARPVYRPAPVASPEPEPEPMDELEVRMAKAQYYWDLMRAELFSDPDEIALEVEAEIRSFVKTRLAELMGTVTKKRGRKPAQTKVIPRARPKVAPRVATAAPRTAAPQTPERDEEEDVVQEIVAPDGSKRVKIYRKMVDAESGRVYYMGYDRIGNKATSDGNRYELGVNSQGGQFFRVFSQQFIPPDQKMVKPMTAADISAASQRHAAETMEAIRKGNSVLAAAVALAQK